MTQQHVVVPKDGSRTGSPRWIRYSEFTVVETPLAYDPDAVSRLRENLAVAVESWQKVMPVITAANLVPNASGRGCDAASVNEWLALVLGAMGELPGAGTAAPATDRPVQPAQPAAAASRPEVAAEAMDAGEAADTPRDEFVDRVDNARFTPLRFRLGYGMTEIDQFLDELSAAISRGESIADLVRNAHFPEYRTRECYLIQDVDEFLVQLVRDYEGATITRPPA